MKKTSLQTADGPTKELFADGTVSGEGKMKSGKRHGKWKFYYRNGQTKAVGKYADGELDGYWNGGVRMGNRSKLAHSQIVYRLGHGRDITKWTTLGRRRIPRRQEKL